MSQRADVEGCAEVLERLDAWIDGDLGEAEAATVSAHLDRCDACRAEQLLAETVASELRTLPELDVPERVLRAVREKTRPSLEGRFRAFLEVPMFRPVTAVAVVAVVVLTVLVLAPSRRLTEPHYSDQEIARAVQETRLAVAYVGSIARRAELRVKERVLDDGVAAKTVRGVRRSMQFIGEAGTAATAIPATPQPDLKGS